jgi:hypothetical protein
VSVTGANITANTTGPGGGGGTGSNACLLPGGAGGGLGGEGGAGGQGGGIFNHGGTLSLSDSTIDANRTGDGGSGGNGGNGACAVPPGGIPICNCKGGNGGAAANGGVGGGIASDLALDALNTTIVSNGTGAGGNGGAAGTFPTGTGCAGTDGLNGRGGGGGSGGGVAQLAGGATLTNLTISLNFTARGGTGAPSGFTGAGSGADVFGGSLTEVNTILDSNGCAGPITPEGVNLWFAASDCPGDFGNPQLGSLQNNGGATQTMALEAGSAAIDKVPATTTSCPPTDQRGFLRPDGETMCDIGSYESGASPIHFKVIAGLTTPPRFFALRLRGTEQAGATVVAVLHRPRVLVLRVVKLESRHRQAQVGLVQLGNHHAGRSTFHWNLRVGGYPLGNGHYQIAMYALDSGRVLSLPANPGVRAVIVQAHGQVRT